jgi:hypothetical protein
VTLSHAQGVEHIQGVEHKGLLTYWYFEIHFRCSLFLRCCTISLLDKKIKREAIKAAAMNMQGKFTILCCYCLLLAVVVVLAAGLTR